VEGKEGIFAVKIRLLLSLILLLTFLLAGCWDRVEIQDRLIVMAVAIDKVRTEDEKRNFYEFTAQLTEAQALSGRISTPNISPVWNASATGPSIFECIRILTTRVARQPYYDHLQIIIIGEELAKEGIDRALDLFYRDHESRPKIKLVIAKGRAREVLDLAPKLMPISGRYISTLMEEGEAKTARFPKTSTIGEFSSYFHGGANCVLPALRIEKQEAKMAGGAIMRGDRLVGWLSDQEIKTLRWLNGTFTAGDEVIVKNGPEQERSVTTFEVRGARSRVKSEIRNGFPVFTFSIRGEGSLAEDGFDHKPSLEKLRAREKEISQNIKENAEKLLIKMQKKKVDIFGLYEEMRRHQHPYWRQHRNNWDEIFQHAAIHVDVVTYIRRFGQFK